MEGVYLDLAPSRLFALPPAALPPTIPAPEREFSLLHPFNIPPDTYDRVMTISLPITIGTIYATTVWWLNRVNKRRKYKPWGFSKSKSFFWFVIAHNVALAVFSGWINAGMLRAISDVLPARGSPAGAATFADALCKMHGPRGYGNAVFFDPEQTKWITLNRSVQLLRNTPDPADLGRLWNEGLAYYGWIFYLSKFYEVVDTMIILAKGKKSSLLQTYHHTGAMLGMWAGMRYMSPPIWCFVIVNSFIHALMYSYYAISALGFRVPSVFKRTLTSMQIMQLVFGASYALVHLIVGYDAPIETPYLRRREVTAALPRVTSSVIAAATNADVGMFLKKLALRAAGGEGLAKNIGKNNPFSLAQSAPAPATTPRPQIEEEIGYRWETARLPCIDTSGEVVAILLNVLYLLPLIYLFVRFFIRSYLRLAESPLAERAESTAARLRASSAAAVKRVEQEIREAMKVTQGSSSDLDLAKTPTSSTPRSTITTPSTTSAPRSGAGTPPTIKPFTAPSFIDDSGWLDVGKEDSKRETKPSPRPSPPASPSPSPSDRREDEEQSIQHSEYLTQSSEAESRLSQETELSTTTSDTNEKKSTLDSNGTAKRSEPNEQAHRSQSIHPPRGVAQNGQLAKTESEDIHNETEADEPVRTDGPGDAAKPGAVEESLETNEDDHSGESSEIANLDGAGDNNDATDEQADMDDPEDSSEDNTVNSLTVPPGSSSPSPSEAQRNAEEAVRRAYEAAEIATRKASEDDTDSILSVETTLTIESMASESHSEARRYEVPGVDEALDSSEQEAERELQPETNG